MMQAQRPRGEKPRHASPIAHHPAPGTQQAALEIASTILWLTTAAIVVGLCARFVMRAFGVRDDIAFPSLIYFLTAPLVEPFYRFFPVSNRFDYYAVEWAALAAAGAVLALALVLYVLGLLVAGGKKRS